MSTPSWLTPGEAALLAAAAKWHPEAHPRGNDGKFIEKGHIASLLSKATSTISEVANASKELDSAKWHKLKPEQQQHIADSIDKLPSGTSLAKDAKAKLKKLTSETAAKSDTGAAKKSIPAHKGASPGTSAKVSTTLVWAKHDAGTTILDSADGKQRVVWNGKKYEVQMHDAGSWKTEQSYTKKDFYDKHKKDSSWTVPGTASKTETLKTEAPKTEAPKAETSKTEVPKTSVDVSDNIIPSAYGNHNLNMLGAQQKQDLSSNLDKAEIGTVVAYHVTAKSDTTAMLRMVKSSDNKYVTQKYIMNTDTWTYWHTLDGKFVAAVLAEGGDWKIKNNLLQPAAPKSQKKKSVGFDTSSAGLAELGFVKHGDELTPTESSYLAMNMGTAKPGSVFAYVPHSDHTAAARIRKAENGMYTLQRDNGDGDWTDVDTYSKPDALAAMKTPGWQINNMHLKMPGGQSNASKEPETFELPAGYGVTGEDMTLSKLDNFKVNILDAQHEDVIAYYKPTASLTPMRISKKSDNAYLMEYRSSSGEWQYHSIIASNDVAYMVTSGEGWHIGDKYLATPGSPKSPSHTTSGVADLSMPKTEDAKSLEYADGGVDWFEVNQLANHSGVPAGTPIAQTYDGKHRIIKDNNNTFTVQKNVSGTWVNSVNGLKADDLVAAYGTSDKWGVIPSFTMKSSSSTPESGLAEWEQELLQTTPGLSAPNVSAPKLPEPPEPPEPPTATDGADITNIPHGVKQNFKATLKDNNVGYWSKPDKIWDSVQQIQHMHPEYTPMQILKSLDSTLKTKEPSPFENKIVKWGKTPKGAAAIGAHGLSPSGSNVTAPSTPSAPSPTGLFPNEGPGDISHLSSLQKANLYKAFKAHSDTHLDSDEKSIYAAVSDVAQQHQLSDLQMLRVLDEVSAQNVSKPNAHLFEKKITNWLQTPKGSLHAAVVAGTADVPSSKQLANNVPPFEPDADPMHNLPSFDESSKYKYHPVTVANTYTLFDKFKAAFEEKTGKPIRSNFYKTYTGGAYGPINLYLYGGYHTISASDASIAKAMQKNMVPSTEPILLHRGVKFAGVGAVNHADLEKKVGQTWYGAGFTSTSTGGIPAFSGSPVMVEIEAPPGTPMHWLKPVSNHPHEDEMLLGAGLSYRIVSVTKAGGKSVVRMRVVPEEPTI